MLQEMGVWYRLYENDTFRWLNTTSLMCDDSQVHVAGTVHHGRCAAIQRYVLDHELAQAAQQVMALRIVQLV